MPRSLEQQAVLPVLAHIVELGTSHQTSLRPGLVRRRGERETVVLVDVVEVDAVSEN